MVSSAAKALVSSTMLTYRVLLNATAIYSNNYFNIGQDADAEDECILFHNVKIPGCEVKGTYSSSSFNSVLNKNLKKTVSPQESALPVYHWSSTTPALHVRLVRW